MDDSLNGPDQHPSFIRLMSTSGSETVHYSALYEELPDEFLLKAEKELNETGEKIKRGILRLKALTKKENLDVLDDHLLLAVLRSCKFNLKKAEAKLRKFVFHRREVIKKIAKVDIAIVERSMDDMGGGILPYRDKHGRVIFFTRPYGMHFENYAIEDTTWICMAIMLFLLSFKMTTVSGIVYFGECKSPNLYIFYPIYKMIKQSLPTMISFPFRISKVELLNEFTLIRWFVKIMSPLMPDKLLKRITFNGPEYENLHKLYPPDILPEEFGGNRGPLSCQFYKEEFLNFFKELKAEAIRTDSNNWYCQTL